MLLKQLQLEEELPRLLLPDEKKISLLKKSDILDKLNALERVLDQADVSISFSELELIKEQKELNRLLVEIQAKELEHLKREKEIILLNEETESLRLEVEAKKKEEALRIEANRITAESLSTLSDLDYEEEEVDYSFGGSSYSSEISSTAQIGVTIAILMIIVSVLMLMIQPMQDILGRSLTNLSSNLIELEDAPVQTNEIELKNEIETKE